MAKVRVYELAKELGVSSKDVLNALKGMGEFIRSASSTVEAPVERRLRQRILAGEVQLRPSPRKPTATSRTSDGADAPDLDLGWPSPAPAWRPAYGSGPKRNSQRSKGRPSSAPRPRREQPKSDPWAIALFSPEYAAEWMAAGIYEPELASRCIDAGLGPADMPIRVDGVRVGERLMGGENISVVLQRLRAAGTRFGSSAQ